MLKFILLLLLIPATSFGAYQGKRVVFVTDSIFSLTAVDTISERIMGIAPEWCSFPQSSHVVRQFSGASFGVDLPGCNKCWVKNYPDTNYMNKTNIAKWNPDLVIMELGYNDANAMFRYTDVAGWVAVELAFWDYILSLNPDVKLLRVLTPPGNASPTVGGPLPATPAEAACSSFATCQPVHNQNREVFINTVKAEAAAGYTWVTFVDTFTNIIAATGRNTAGTEGAEFYGWVDDHTSDGIHFDCISGECSNGDCCVVDDDCAGTCDTQKSQDWFYYNYLSNGVSGFFTENATKDNRGNHLTGGSYVK